MAGSRRSSTRTVSVVDAGRGHIKIAPHEDAFRQSSMAMINLCPAGCYSLNETGKMEIVDRRLL